MSGTAYEPAPWDTLSPSQVSTFCGCPAKWMFRKLLRLPDPPTGARTLGTAVHAAVGENYAQKLETREDLPVTGVVALFREAWDLLVRGEFPHRHGKPPELPTEFREDEDPAEMMAQGDSLCRLYMEDVAPRVEPAAVEIPVAGRIGGVAVRGIVDLLDITGRVVDLKTAARKPTDVSPDYRFQIATYAQLTPGASGQARLDTLTKNKPPLVHSADFAINQQDVESTARMYPLVQQAMRAGNYFPNRNHWACNRRFCGYWRQCSKTYGGTIPE